MSSTSKIRVGVVGASGYGGLELLRLLSFHPDVQVTYAAGSQERDGTVADMYPFLSTYSHLQLEKYDVDRCADRCDAVFVALPSGASGAIAGQLHERGRLAIDLSGDLRLPADTYASWYQKPPVAPKVIGQAVYGLTEWNRNEIRGASLIANPGCYATAVLLGLLPAVKAKLAAPDRPLIVDAKSGVSGAGRSATLGGQLGELSDNFYPYRVGKHQHTPEIERYLAQFGLAEKSNEASHPPIVFTTQLLPAIRGIYASCYIPLGADVQVEQVVDIYRTTYEGEPFIRIHDPGKYPELKHVRGSNQTHIGLFVDNRTATLQVFSALDNLQKGAAGQALQNFNVAMGLDQTTGLSQLPIYP